MIACLGTMLALVNESAFSMMYLSDLHAAATAAAQQEQLLTAGEAVIAGNMWNSTAGFLAGIFMQGGFVFISFVLVKFKTYEKIYCAFNFNGFCIVNFFCKKRY